MVKNANVEAPPTPSPDPFSPDFAAHWLDGLIDQELLKPGVVLIPHAGMADTAVLFSKRGFRVKFTDASGDGVRAARNAGADIDAFDRAMFNVKPWHLGPVNLIVDHSLLESLESGERFAYANRVGRFLAKDGLLAGVFRIGEPGKSPPYATPLDNFKHMLLRYFTPEIFEPAVAPAPGQDTAWVGLLRRK